MSDNEESKSNESCEGPLGAVGVSRREFLKLAGVAGATIGVGSALGGILAGCGGEATTTTSADGSSTTAASLGTVTTDSSATAGAEKGAEIKIGFVSPQTGGLASFGVPDAYCADRAREVIGEGVLGGDGKVHPVTIIIKDSQSDSNRAAQVTGDLINNDQVDMIVAASTPDTTAPVADQAETNAVPCITNDTPWQPFIATRSGGKLDAVYKWTYHTFWGLEDVQASYLDMWGQISNNQVVGAMFPNDADGNAWLPGWEAVWQPAGLQPVIPSQFQDGTEDFTAQIAEFKKAGAEIGMGVFIPPDFTNFWKQSIQQGWKPKVASYAKALLFPQSVEALGAIANNLTTEVWWTPSHPFTSSLLGETCQQFADEFTKRTSKQWTQPLLHFVIFEMAIDAIKQATDPKNKDDIIAAVKVTKLDTIGGPIDFSAPVEPAGPPWKVGPRHIVENVYKTPLVGGQWRKGAQYPFELTIVSNKAADMIPVQDKVQLYTAT